MIVRILAMAAAVIVLSGCAEVNFASHVAKKAVGPTSSQTQGTTTGASPIQQGNFKIGNPYQIQGQTYYPKESYDHVETGIASWYGPGFHGKKTANGERFDTTELTAAHRTLQMPSLVRVTNLENGRSVIVRVNDRGPFSRGRVIDVSERAADLLGFKVQGTAKVKLEVLTQESLQIAEMAKRGESTRGTELAASQGRLPTGGHQQSSVYQTASHEDPRTVGVQPVHSEPLTPIPGHTSADGHFMPDPVVTQMPVGTSNIYVQAGSFSVYDNADRLRQSLSSIGNTGLNEATVNGTRFYRVRVGPLSSVTEADRVLSRVVAAGHGKAVIIVD